MRYQIENLSEITDSREIMKSKPNGFSKYMMYIIISLLAVVIIWSVLAKKEISVTANGVVKPSEEIYKVTSNLSGNVNSVILKEGMEVRKGDILLVIDGGESEIQYNALKENLDKKEKEIEVIKKLIKSVKEEKNYLSKDNELESSYYEKYELYKKTMDEYNKQGSVSEKQISSLETKNEDLKSLLKSIEEEKNYFSSEHYMYYQYLDYEMKLNQYKDKIENYNNQVKDLQESKKENNTIDANNSEELDNSSNTDISSGSNETIDKQIETVTDSIKALEDEIAIYKNSQISTIKSSISQNEESLKQGVTTESNTTYKDQYLTQLYTQKSSLEDSLQEVKMNIDLLNFKLDSSSVKAKYDGTINIINEIKAGDYIQTGTQIASIVPSNSSNFLAEIYIENRNIGEISKDSEVILELASLPQNEYGIIKTKLDNISIDAKVNETQGTSYYIGKCLLKETNLENFKGKKIDIKNGMLLKARIVNRKVSYLRYFLELINILK